ncbi:MAG: PGF-pre-PGF domain-containing protein [Methanosarcina barkeri]|nr:PGF-pre-PGF domain-containing protein [Methanosarcina sp. ERenArc_MAG2]
MKAGFFGSLIYILLMMLIIPGMTPGMASALDGNLGNDGNSTIGNSTIENPDIGNSTIENPDIGHSDTGNTDTGNSDIGNSSSENSSKENSSNGNVSNANVSNVNSSTENSSTENSSTENSSTEESGGGGSSSSSSSSSGSGVVSREPATNIYAKELVTRSIMSGYPVRFDFVENVTITYIEFDPIMTFKKTTTIAEVLKNRSVLVPKASPGKIYKYVNIWVGNKGAGLPTSLKNGFVGFKVEKAWIEDKNINESLVTLQLYDKGWQPLHTEKVKEDENYVYFKAETPGYSSFAITEYSGQEEKRKLGEQKKYRKCCWETKERQL